MNRPLLGLFFVQKCSPLSIHSGLSRLSRNLELLFWTNTKYSNNIHIFNSFSFHLGVDFAGSIHDIVTSRQQNILKSFRLVIAL
jgi:hypothetical protein